VAETEVSSKYYDSSSLVEIIHPQPPMLKIEGLMERSSLPSFLIPLSREIMEAPPLKKVKMPTIDPFKGTFNLDDHLDVQSIDVHLEH